jgi:ABC-2 type transport system ATP-binding protein
MSIAVEARSLSRRFGAVEAVRNLTFEVASGEVFGLVGPDGAGKTTTLRMLCGLLDPDQGEAIVDGLKVKDHGDAVKDAIGYMAQKFGLYGDLTVEENMDFYGDLFGIFGSTRDALKSRLLKMTRMEPFRNRPAAKLSGGMKQKLSLMCTLLHKPRILFLDEPTNGVDPVSRRDFWLILEELVRDGLTVIVSTAYLDEAERCHRVALMHEGRIVVSGTPAELKAGLPEKCYSVKGPNLRALKRTLEGRDGVVNVEMSGADLHLFLSPAAAIFDVMNGLDAEAERITPELEDILIAEIHRLNRKAAA